MKKVELLLSIVTYMCIFFLLSIEISFEEGIDQPINGCYLGAYLGGGLQDSSYISPKNFNKHTGKKHAFFSRYIDASTENDLLNSSHWEWADTLKSINAKPVFFLGPYGELNDFINGKIDSALVQFARSCYQFGDTVFIIFGHEMNGTWYPWGQQPNNYIAAFQRADSLLKATASNVIMCWVPLQAWGYPWGGFGIGQGYDEYYPGDDYVDWIGLNTYDRDWDENNIVSTGFVESALNYLNFYQTYAAQKDKPMLIAETALFDANWDPTAPGTRISPTHLQLATEKNQWINQIYDVNLLSSQFPNLNMICYFHVLKHEYDFSTTSHNFGAIIVDWRIPLDLENNVYSQIISNPYFLPEIATNIIENDNEQKFSFYPSGYKLFQNYPNPFNFTTTISYQLPKSGNVYLAIFNTKGQLIETLINNFQTVGLHHIAWNTKDAGSGLYHYLIKTDEFSFMRKCILLK